MRLDCRRCGAQIREDDADEFFAAHGAVLRRCARCREPLPKAGAIEQLCTNRGCGRAFVTTAAERERAVGLYGRRPRTCPACRRVRERRRALAS